ncbi:MAG: preprotein translocase subunit SecG [Ignavibacteriae bacterium]|nr:preprotein translocase subunit SecG [Ignavibacteriota bacterium]
MYTVLVSLISLLGIILIGAVLIQPGKADMASGMSGIGGQLGSMFGSRRTADTLTKITIGIAGTILLLSLVTNKFFLGVEAAQERNAVTIGAEKPPAPIQKAPATQPQQSQPQVQPQQAQPQPQQAPPPQGK